ncbi:MAG: DUF2284 domain-containing protein, partial [Muribaculaceae bacterium]|nr:DUF2284 domain-containing protein [Muribaculaceae bacterium]
MTRIERDLDLQEYIARYYNPLPVSEACRACPRHAATWACPPFAFDAPSLLSRYTRIRLIACTFTVSESPDFDTIAPIRRRLNTSLLELEDRLQGHAFYFGGSCTLCPRCTRPQGQPCRHPLKMRPSLEAFGFDLIATLADHFNITLSWS